MLDWGTCPREAGPPGPRLSSLGERERNAVMANRVGVNMLQFCSVSNSLSRTTLSIKWEVYFSKELCRSSLLCLRYDSACICVCIVGHGYITAGRPAFARPCEGVHRSTSLMSSSLLLQQCPACLVRLILIAFVMGGRWPYSCCFVGCCLQDLFNIARSIIRT